MTRPRSALTLLVLAAAAAAQDDAASATEAPGSTTTTITTTTTTTTTTAPMQLEETTVKRSRARLEALSGVRFGGITGASLVATLDYDTRTPVRPEAQAQVGISGTRLALGARWTLDESRWKMTSGSTTFTGDAITSLTPRAIACYRWEDEDRAPSIWRGIVGHDGWYLGAEMGVLVRDVALDVAITWRQDDPKQPQYTLSYGFDF